MTRYTSVNPVGLIGGMSWESTSVYYRLLNEKMQAAMGGHHSFPCVIHSMDFDAFERLSHQEDWDAIAEMLFDMALDLERAGVSAIALCSNTAHLVVDSLRKRTAMPVISIVESVGRSISEKQFRKVALLGTRFTMTHGFYQTMISHWCNAQIMIPEETAMNSVHHIIYNELCKGVVSHESRNTFLKIIDDLKKEGAEAVILGCTEIGMLIGQSDASLEVLDSTLLHCDSIIQYAFNQSKNPD